MHETKIDDFDEEQIKSVIKAVLSKHQDVAKKYRNGQKQVIGFLVGEVKKKINQNIDVKMVKGLIEGNI
ncbi:MAG: hypothetical protein FWG90_04910 [Oscillospiraceae bacterium]|nr:hypothetical protein [Oscillospiraceae bacterium]